MPFLGTILFTAFGKQISVKHVLLAILGIAVAVALFFAFRWINSYFQHIKDIEAENVQLHKDNATLTEQKKQLIQLNAQNEQTRVTEDQIHSANQDIATEERHASQTRTVKYREISHAIQSAPPSAPAPVSPVINNTLDGLWGPAPPNGK